MKKQFLIAIGLFFAISIQAQQDPILMQINGKPVTKSDFLQIYLKNNQQPKYDKASLDEYMELFKKFKLKVTEAEALGYDTLPKLKKELDGYKKQLALPYLIDAGKNQEFVKEAYDRTKNEIRASHILIRIEPTASPADTLIAFNKIMALKARIDKGEDFAAVAKGRNGSEDPSAQTNGGDLGFFNAFQMVYPFEDQAYKTEIGKVSMPFRTRFGYHIVKVTDTRITRGTIKTAHIMVSIPKTATQEEIATGEKKIYEIYTKLMNGEKFEDLAKNFSDDPSSNQKGGELSAFGTGTTTRMVPSFEDAAYALLKDGEFSQPIRTEYGFHIIKRLELKPLKSFEELKKELQNKVNKDERSKKTQDFFVEKLKTTYNFVDVSKKSKKWFVSNLDTTYFIGKWHPTNLKTEKPLFMLDGKTYTQKDFASYLESNYKGIKKDAAKNIVELQFKNWVKATILSYEESKLTTKYPEYKALVNEYHDGILLYEIMSDKVWN
jgi:peptidyl-prolyl cis-trans isomerase SurA